MKYQNLKKILINFLRGKFIKLALKKALGSAAMGGFKGWLISYIATYLFDEVLVPLVDYIEDKGMLFYDKNKGKIQARKLEEAKEGRDENSYNDIIDDI